jgi:ADP-ribosyl-[dinitrogen reductase] hydrolase
MRSLPVALAYWNAPLEEMVRASRLQSHVTHNNPVADAGTEAVLQIAVSALCGTPKEAMQEITTKLVEHYDLFRFDSRRVDNPSGWIVETLKAVFQAFFDHTTLEDTVVDVVNRGGDSDTTGAIAGMLAGAYYGIDSIPEQWIRALDKEVKQQCETQALQLLALAAERD